MILPPISGRVTRLANRLAVGKVACTSESISVMRWSDSKIFSDVRTGVYEIDNAIVTTAFSVLSQSRREIYLDTTYEFAERFFQLSYVIDKGRFHYIGHQNALSIDGPAILIGGSPEDGSWYHWNLNWAPRLSLLSAMRPDLLRDQGIPIVFHSHVSRRPFLDFLDIFNIDSKRCVYVENNQDIHCKKLFVPTFTSQMLYAKKYIIDLAARCRRAARVFETPEVPHDRIFISRQNFSVPRRRIWNYEDVLPVLERHGATSFIADGLTMAEQVRAFSQAETIIGVHGAGLTSMIFADTGACVVVVDTRANIAAGHAGMFTALAEMGGHRYFIVPCDDRTPPEPTDAPDVPHMRDVIVAPDAMADVLDRIAFLRAGNLSHVLEERSPSPVSPPPALG